MANTLDTYADAVIMECLLTKDSGAIGNEYIDDVITSLRPYVFASFTDLDTVSLPNVTVIPEGAFFETEVETDLDLDWGRVSFFWMLPMARGSAALPAPADSAASVGSGCGK